MRRMSLPFSTSQRWNAVLSSHLSILAIQEFGWPRSKNSFLYAMTPSTYAPQPPGWYRLLPRPPTEHNPALHRTSSLLQHHLFPDPSPGHSSEEDVPRRNTIHGLEGSNSTADSATYIGGGCSTTNAVPESSVSAPRSRSLDMEKEQSQSGAFPNRSHPREHLCLCPPDPKIPRPRNCEVS